MQTSDDAPDLLVDTSVAIALSISDHPAHHETSAAVRGRLLGLAGHAAFETFSVLTRLPTPLRRKPGVIGEIIRRNFPASRFLSPEATASLLARLPQLAIAGGAVYDALVAMAAVEHGLTLATRDRRAADTYRALGTKVEIIG